MILGYRRNRGLKATLAKKVGKGRSCPACSTTLEFVEGGTDRATYRCPKCNETITFTSAPDLKNKPPKKGSAITLRDRSGERKKPALANEPTVTDDLKIDQIRACMEEKSILGFAYDERGTGFSSRSVEPYKLTVDSLGEIILYAFDIDGNGIRKFKLNKMKALEKQEFCFSPRWPIEDKLGGQAGSKKES